MPKANSADSKTPSVATRQKATRFTLHAPAATSVHLAGSFNDWNPSALGMRCSDDGYWFADVALPPGRYEYKFVVDGGWCCDVSESGPSEVADGCVPNDHGTMNRVIEVASA